MKIAYGPVFARDEFTYEFSPPMHAGEARKRLEEMHAQAKVQLGIVRPLSLPLLFILRPFLPLAYFLETGRRADAPPSRVPLQSDAVVSGLPLSVPAIVGTAGLVVLCYFLVNARPERVAAWVPWQVRAFAPLVRLAGLDPDSPAHAGRGIKAFWLGLLFVTHLFEIPACLEPQLKRYNVESPLLRLAWVRSSLCSFLPPFLPLSRLVTVPY